MNKNTLSMLLAIWVLGISALAVAGCNTSKGFGQDVESAGQAIQDEADDAD